jgi:hypothetical protein
MDWPWEWRLEEWLFAGAMVSGVLMWRRIWNRD